LLLEKWHGYWFSLAVALGSPQKYSAYKVSVLKKRERPSTSRPWPDPLVSSDYFARYVTIQQWHFFFEVPKIQTSFMVS
jgi:hypothetical protein